MKNQLKAGVLLSYISEGIKILAALLYTPIMLRLLGQSEYGLYQLSSSVIAYLSLLSLGFGSSYIRYYSRYKVKNDSQGIARLNGMFMTVFLVIGIISALAGAVLIKNIDLMFKNSLSADEIGTARILMALMVFNLAISFPGSVFSSHITANEQYIFQRIVIILNNLLNPFMTLPLLLMGYKSIAVVAVQTVLALAALAANWIFCKKKLGMTFDFKEFDWRLLKELFIFSFWIFLNQIMDQVNSNVDKFILGIYRGAEEVAVYGVAMQINMMCVCLSCAISGVFAPRVNRIAAGSDDNREFTELFTRVGRIQCMLMLLVVSGFTIFGKYFVILWAGEEYTDSYYIAMLLLAGGFIPWIQNLGIEIQRAKNMHQLRSIVYTLLAIINVVVSIPLAKYHGGVGAAFGTFAALIIGNVIIMNIIYHKKIGLNILHFWREILKFIPAMLLPAAFGYAVMKHVTLSGIPQFAALIAAYAAIYCMSMWLFGMNEYEKNLIKTPLKKLKRRIHD